MNTCFEKDLDLLGYEFEQDFTLTKKSICVDRTIFPNEDKNINMVFYGIIWDFF